MVKFELGKIVRWYFILIFAGLIIIKCISVYFVDRFDYENSEDEIYNEYIEMLEGNITVEKEQYILNEWLTICQNLSKSNEMAEKYISGKISRDEYAAFNDDYMYAQSRIDSLNKVMEDYRYIKVMYQKTHSRIKPEFINSRYWDYFFSSTGVSWMPILLIVVISVFSSSVEQSSGMWNIINASYNGKAKMLAAKMCTSALTGGIISFAFAAAEFLAYYKFFGLSSLDAPIQSLHIFYSISADVSIKTGVIALILWRTAAGCGIALITLLISVLIKKDVVSLLIMVILIFVPVFILNIVPGIFARSFCGLYNGVNTVLEAAGTRPMAVFSDWTLMICAVVILFVFNLIRLGYRVKR